MRIVHQSGSLQMLGGTSRQVHLPGALRLQARRSGWLWVDGGAAWITRQSEGVDHVLSGADALYLRRGDDVVAEPWRAGQAVGLRWAQAADAQALGPQGRAEGAEVLRLAPGSGLLVSGTTSVTASLWMAAVWRALAAGLRGLAGALAAAARTADARASRA